MLREVLLVIKREEKFIKIAAGILLAFCTVLAQMKWFKGNVLMMAALYFFAFCYMGIGLLRIEPQTKKGCVALNVFWGLLFVLCSIFTSTPIYPSAEGIKIIGLNYLCATIVFVCVYIVIARWKCAMVIAMAMVVLLITANACVFQFRAVEISVMDFLSLKTALSVANQYQVKVTKRIAGLLFVYVFFAFSAFALPKIPCAVSSGKRRITAVLAMIVSVLVLQAGAANIRLRTWRDEGTVLNGYLLNFYIGIREMKMEVPEGYSAGMIEELYGQYWRNSEIQLPEKLPNVVVIMDEAFADFNCFENALSANRPITPFIDSLSENVIKGYALCSVFGGNTANSEFEFLTGHNMMFLPASAVPYQQYIRGNLFSLPWLLREYGYVCNSTHPYSASGWARNVVYPYLGFENSYFLEDYPEEKMVRCYVSDEEVFDEIVTSINAEDNPLFLFAITMQNHGDYNYVGENYEKTVTLTGEQQGYPGAEQYLSLLTETDRAVESLITTLQNSEEDTVVLFFGDHYPKVEFEFYEAVNGGGFNGLDAQQKQYKVPFFIWANYDMPSGHVECTSLSYLGRYLLESANLPLSPYYTFLRDMEQNIPALNAKGFYSKEHARFITFEDAEGSEKEALDVFMALQYNNLFDSKNRNQGFFGEYVED